MTCNNFNLSRTLSIAVSFVQRFDSSLRISTPSRATQEREAFARSERRFVLVDNSRPNFISPPQKLRERARARSEPRARARADIFHFNIAFHWPARKAGCAACWSFFPAGVSRGRTIREMDPAWSLSRSFLHRCNEPSRSAVRAERSSGSTISKTRKWSGASATRRRRRRLLWKSPEHSGNFPRVFERSLRSRDGECRWLWGGIVDTSYVECAYNIYIYTTMRDALIAPGADGPRLARTRAINDGCSPTEMHLWKSRDYWWDRAACGDRAMRFVWFITYISEAINQKAPFTCVTRHT